MSGLDDYGHGEGQGKSRQSVYKHLKKVGLMNPTPPKVASVEPTPKTDTDTQPEVDEPESGWDDFRIDIEDIGIHTIPTPIKMIAKAGSGGSPTALLKAQAEVQKLSARWVFTSVDRLITWWGRGVMNDQNWEVKRSQADYDLLQDTTVSVMELYGIEIPISPWAIWGITVGSAYVPQIAHVRKNASPNRKRRKWRFFGWFRKGKRQPKTPLVDDEENNPYA